MPRYLGFLFATSSVLLLTGIGFAGGDCFGGLFETSYSTEYLAFLMGWAALVVLVVSRGLFNWKVSLGVAAVAAGVVWYHLDGNRDWLADLPVLGALLILTIVAGVRLVRVGRKWFLAPAS